MALDAMVMGAEGRACLYQAVSGLDIPQKSSNNAGVDAVRQIVLLEQNG